MRRLEFCDTSYCEDCAFTGGRMVVCDNVESCDNIFCHRCADRDLRFVDGADDDEEGLLLCKTCCE